MQEQPGTQLDVLSWPCFTVPGPVPRRQVYTAFREGASWPRLLAPGQTFSVESRVWSCSNLSSSQVGGSVVAVWGGPEHYPHTPIPTIPPSQRMHRCLVLQRCMATGLRAHSGVAHARRCRSTAPRPQLLSVRAKDAVCDAIRDARGTKPLPPDTGRVADLPLYCTAYHDRLSIYRDMSGASLHRQAASRSAQCALYTPSQGHKVRFVG